MQLRRLGLGTGDRGVIVRVLVFRLRCNSELGPGLVSVSLSKRGGLHAVRFVGHLMHDWVLGWRDEWRRGHGCVGLVMGVFVIVVVGSG